MRVLLRGYVDPRSTVTAAEVLEHDLIARNSGNLIFGEAAFQVLDRPDTDLTVTDFRGWWRQADRINAEFDAVVLPFANAFRPEYLPTLRRFTRLVRRLTVPVTVLGIGAQSDLDYTFDPLAPVEDDVRDFVSAVLDRGPSIGVRGEFSAAYLAHLGFSDVEVVGCPSVFRHGAALPPTRTTTLTRESPLAINLTPSVEHPGLLAHHLDRYPNLAYVAQSGAELRTLLEGTTQARGGPDHPRDPADRVYAEGRTRFFLDAPSWIDFLRGVDFTFGTRIHGNVASLLAGTPAHVLAHDSRTRELSEYLGIPCTRVDRLVPGTDAAELHARSDPRPFQDGHAARLDRFRGYLDAHAVPHTLGTDR